MLRLIKCKYQKTVYDHKRHALTCPHFKLTVLI